VSHSKVVLRTREDLPAVKPVGKSLVLELMHFKEELADPGRLGLPNIESGTRELEMALSLVKAMSEMCKPEKYHDEYAEALTKVIDEKIAAGGKELPAVGRKRGTGMDQRREQHRGISRHSRKPTAKPRKKTRKRLSPEPQPMPQPYET
jgi:DNA end-binding protein Ku